MTKKFNQMKAEVKCVYRNKKQKKKALNLFSLDIVRCFVSFYLIHLIFIYIIIIIMMYIHQTTNQSNFKNLFLIINKYWII